MWDMCRGIKKGKKVAASTAAPPPPNPVDPNTAATIAEGARAVNGVGDTVVVPQAAAALPRQAARTVISNTLQLNQDVTEQELREEWTQWACVLHNNWEHDPSTSGYYWHPVLESHAPVDGDGADRRFVRIDLDLNDHKGDAPALNATVWVFSTQLAFVAKSMNDRQAVRQLQQ